ncbi:serine protein kinase RIO [Candidatus Woesearchaeota archaeon]|nr:serine protein kinase RIO [Candidatus Woesearchaeota archaeon]
MARKAVPEKFKTYEAVFDRFTLQNIFKLGKYFDPESLSPVSIGKESNVFSVESRVSDKQKLIVKIHRLETSDFNRMYSYISGDPRFSGLKKRRREIIFAWVQREFRNLMVAREAGVRAPLPVAFLKNILVMEFIGNNDVAPKVKDAFPNDPEEFFIKVTEHMRRYYRAGFVHGDLSKFNILNHNGSPVLIDFSQAMPVKAASSGELLKRDVVNVVDFFRKLGVDASVERVFGQITKGKRGVRTGSR